MRQQQRKLITAKAADSIFSAHTALNAAGHLLQHLVANHMAIVIVDLLKQIQINKNHRDADFITCRVGEGLRHSIGKQKAVRQARQLIVISLKTDLFFLALTCGDVPHAAQGTDKFPLCQLVLGVNPHGIKFNQNFVFQIRLHTVRFGPQTHLNAATCPLTGALLTEKTLNGISIFRMNQKREMPPENFVAMVTQQAFGHIIDKSKYPAGIEHVDEIGRIIDNKTVHPLRFGQRLFSPPQLLAIVLPLDPAPDGYQQILWLIRLADKIVSTQPQGFFN